MKAYEYVLWFVLITLAFVATVAFGISFFLTVTGCPNLAACF